MLPHMSSRPLILLTIVLALSPTLGQALPQQSPAGPTTEDDIRQVLAIDDARRPAMLRGDVITLADVLAEEVTIFWGDGTEDGKASTLEQFRSGRLKYAQYDYGERRVRLYGDTAIVTGNAHVRLQADRRDQQHTINVTRVYVRQTGRQTTRTESSPASLAQQEPAAEGQKTVSLADLRFMGAHFRAEWGDTVADEIWAPPLGNCMTGVFRLVAKGKVQVYEIMVVEQTEQGPVLRLHHFDPGLKVIDEDRGLWTYRLVEFKPGYAIFEKSDKSARLLYARSGAYPKQVTRFDIADGKKATRVFRYRRVRPRSQESSKIVC
jgi:ketosteroid isomerase-like protein